MKISKFFHDLCCSHIIPNHPGKCRNLHGHNFQVCVEIEGPRNKETGMVVDYGDLKKIVQPVYNRLDHQHLNFHLVLPTAENLAFYFAHEIYYKVAAVDAKLSRVTVKETSTTDAVWTEADLDELIKPPAEGEKRGWDPPFEDIAAFSDEDSMVRYIMSERGLLDYHMKILTRVGAKIAAFHRYQSTLDEASAARLLRLLEEEKKKGS